jgi:hypothetical protein
VDDPEVLDLLLMMWKLRRMSCPFCRAITAKPMESQAAFVHRFFPASYHSCQYQGRPE